MSSNNGEPKDPSGVFQQMAFPTPPPDYSSSPAMPVPQQPKAEQQAPPSGYRIPLTTYETLQPETKIRITSHPTLFRDLDASPIYIGSAITSTSVQPCKVGFHLETVASYAYGGVEVAHQGRYDLLPFDGDTMEFVPTSYGRIPEGRRPVDGGYEESGAKLFHAIGTLNGLKVPGKTGEHLGGCNISFGGREHVIVHGYDILCWK